MIAGYDETDYDWYRETVGVICKCECGCRRLVLFADGHRSGTEKCDPCWYGHYASDAKPHVDEPSCWCRPAKSYTDPVTGAEVWVHRYADD